MRIKQKSKKGYKINGSFNKSKMADQKDGLFKKWMFWKKKHPLKFELSKIIQPLMLRLAVLTAKVSKGIIQQKIDERIKKTIDKKIEVIDYHKKQEIIQIFKVKRTK